MFEEREKLFSALQAGASGYLLKKSKIIEIIEAIHEIYNGGSPMTPIIARKVLAPPTALKYNDAIDSIMKITQKQERAAKDIFKEMKAHQMITQGPDKHWRINMNN